MKQMTNPAAVALFMFCALFALSCTVENSLDIEESGEAVLSTNLEISGVALEYLQDLSAVQGVSDSDASIFIPEQIAAYFEQLNGVDAENIILTGLGGLSIRLRFDDIGRFFQTEKFIDVPDILRIESGDNGRERLQLVFHRDNMDQLMRILPMGEDPVSQSGMMLFEDHGTKEEFREMMQWLFEEYADREEIEEALDSSLLTLVINMPRTVIDTDMERLPDGRLKVSIPVIEFFTLETPISYYAEY